MGHVVVEGTNRRRVLHVTTNNVPSHQLVVEVAFRGFFTYLKTRQNADLTCQGVDFIVILTLS